MRDNTVNESNRRYPENITERHADITDKLKFTYFACGKESDEKKKMAAKENTKKSSFSIIENLRKNGELVAETDVSASIKAYPNTQNKEKATNEKRNEDMTH